MIKGPWPLAPDKTRHIIPLDPPFLTPRLDGERVALRVSEADSAKATRGLGEKGVITDLDTGERYRLIGADCGGGKSPTPRCYCDAEIIPLPAGN